MIFANQGLRAAHAAIDRTFEMLAQSESAEVLGSRISPVSTVASLVGAQKVVELEALLAARNGKPRQVQPGKWTLRRAPRRPHKS
jgi:hypothetical protein